MKIKHTEDRFVAIILGFTLLFGVGLASSAIGHVRDNNGDYNQNPQDRNWNNYPNWGGSFELRQTALNAGYNEGAKEGRNDYARGRRSNLQDFSAYQEATKDYNSRLGDRELYRRYFRRAFENGYNSELQTTYDSTSRLNGTFRLDSSRSDNPRNVANRATRNLRGNERQGVSARMLARLESPEMLAIERRYSTITMASSLAPQSTFEADGVERQEQLDGRTIQVTATLRGDQLVVRSTGYRNNDFTATFEPIESGRRLRVRREVYSDRLTQPVVVNSIYNRSSDVAQWNVYDGSQPGGTTVTSGEFIVRDGETVVAVLNSDLTSQQAKQGDRFTLTVREPGQYEGAVIEGTVGSVDRGGRLTGRSGMSLNFDTIRLRNGRTYRFAGVLGSVRTPNGDTVKVDNEGTAQGENQTTQTVQRTAIGTAVGAIIGAIAGGGKGAAIGAIIGAAGGAGSVYVQGKDNLELPTGTEITIRSSAPSQ
ncbi:MAG TPA: YMGG-like glycine zipper-containing protein [Pyrinomonadaceae bacterium]|nr:YMGG-like glycine zipper-containing protein [Pyrinomonadaceae bacterium]